MKILKRLLIVFVVFVFVLVLGLWVFIKNFDSSQYKGQIIQSLSNALGTNVDLKWVGLNLSLKQGITLDVEGLAIADLPQFSQESVVAFDLIHLQVDWMSFLTKRQLAVTQVIVKFPKIHIVRNKGGELNLEVLSQRINKPQSKDLKLKSGNPSMAIPALLVSAIDVTGAEISFTDQSLVPPVSITVSDMDIKAKDISLSKPFNWQITLNVFGDQQNIRAKGSAQLDMKNTSVRFDDILMNTDLSSWKISRINQSLPVLANAGLEGVLKGQLKMEINPVILGVPGLLLLSAEGSLEDAQVKFKTLAYPIENMDIHFKVTENELNIKDFFLVLASGKISGRARVDEYLGSKKFSLSVGLDDIRLSELVAENQLPVKLSGKVFGKWEMKGIARDESTFKESLEGFGELEIKEGKVIGVNILKQVLDKLSMIPNLQARIEENIPQRYKDVLSKQDTDIQVFNLQSRIHDGLIDIDPARVEAEGFECVSQATLDLTQNLTLDSKVYISRELSSGLIAGIPEFSYLTDSNGRIEIPLKSYEGKAAQVSFVPNIETMAKKVIANKGKQELQKVIFKALDIKDQSPELVNPDKNQPQNPSQAPATDESPEKVLIESVLDSIFK